MQIAREYLQSRMLHVINYSEYNKRMKHIQSELDFS